jgi:hypothetical protein
VFTQVAELLHNRGRGVSATTCAALFGLFAVTVATTVTFATTRWGSLSRWPLAYRAAVVLLSVVGSCSWWWINGAVEGERIVALSPTHGLTVGDLLVTPALLLAATLVAVSVWDLVVSRPRRGRRDPRPVRSA